MFYSFVILNEVKNLLRFLDKLGMTFLLMLHTALTNLVFTEELFKEVDKLEEEAAYTAFVAVAGAIICFVEVTI